MFNCGDEEEEKFTVGGACAFDDCQVTLLLDDKTRLYACKHRLATVSEFFKTMFKADFKEKNETELKIREVSRADMLLFLRCAAEQQESALGKIPHGSELSLIPLADMFMCQLLKDRLLDHLSSESFSDDTSDEKKEALLLKACEHKQGFPEALEKCIQLCATMRTMSIAALRDKTDVDTLSAIFVHRIKCNEIQSPPCLAQVKLFEIDKDLLM